MEEYPWIDPIAFTESIAPRYEDLCLLFSGAKHAYSGTKSFLAFGDAQIFANDSAIKEHLQQFPDSYLFGYFAYEINGSKSANNNFINFPLLRFCKYEYLVIFDHETQKIHAKAPLEIIKQAANYKAKNSENKTTIDFIKSNMDDQSYLQKVLDIKEDIISGDYYQANLTRKYWGQYQEGNIDHLQIFKQLCKINPAPYSSFIKLKDKSVISSSPERFIKIDKDGKINTRPIKGTNKKTENNQEAIDALSASEKDRAENMMIVDLMRNDLSKYAKFGSVKVNKLFAIDSYATLNHMSSEISALKHDSVDNFDIVTGAMPPGSMTGAPKLKVTQRLEELEQLTRGIYSGSIGYFKGQESCDFSVVIRTIFMEKNKFSYQVGGGIVFDSKPELELEETKIKDYALRKVLGFG